MADHLFTREIFLKMSNTEIFTMKKEMEWNEMKWNEMEWNEMKWNGMEWNEMEWK